MRAGGRRLGRRLGRARRPAPTAITLAAWALASAPALPVEAKVVQYFALVQPGRGDGGNPDTPTSNLGGIPACNRGYVAHLNASVPAQGFVEVGTGSAPQSIRGIRPLRYGSGGATGPPPTLSMAGAVGDNGGASFTPGTCRVALGPSFLPSRTNSLTRWESFRWPADRSLATAMFSSPAPHTGLTLGTGPARLTLAPGAGPGALTLSPSPAQSQLLRVQAGPNQLGGGFRASGGAQVRINLNLAPGVTASGTWWSGPLPFGHSGPTPTRVARDVATLTTNVASAMVPVDVSLWGLPFTTGTVRAEDHGGDFTTIRERRGRDNRTPDGEHGSLLLVSPWTASVRGLGAADLYWSGTSEVRFFFLPEPGAGALLAAAVAGVLALHRRTRRR